MRLTRTLADEAEEEPVVAKVRGNNSCLQRCLTDLGVAIVEGISLYWLIITQTLGFTP
ncbi:hypothetical protein [Hafnia sp.]|uniref:hypothetical protein n=1 Tax=Hafnia sp. TaxID=1873498 RepID=UPI002FC78C18